MAKIAMVSIPLWGHINVTLSLGMVLLERGHEVTWCIPSKMPELVLPTGGKLAYTCSSNSDEVREIMHKLLVSNSKPGLVGTKYVMEEILVPLSLAMYSGLSMILDNDQFDVVVSDEQTYAGAMCAFQKSIPCITTHSVPSGIFESTGSENIKNWYVETLSTLQEKLGIQSSTLHYQSDTLGLVFCPKTFSDVNDSMPTQKFVGPCIDVQRIQPSDFDFSVVEDRRIKNIMVSIGTLLAGEAKRFFTHIIREFGGSPCTMIVSADPDLMESWPENFIVNKRLPNSKLLNYLDVIITHGGANTVCDAIGMGIPLIVIPMAYDQYYLGDQVSEHKLGFRFKYKRLREGELKKAVDVLTAEGNVYQQNIDRFAEIFKQGGGAKGASDHIEDYLMKMEKGQMTPIVLTQR